MSIEDKAKTINELVQASFRNAMDAVEGIHQTAAEMPIDVFRELGYPEDKAESIKDSHRRILRILYGGISSAHEDLGKLVVQQFGELGKFVNSLMQVVEEAAPAAKKPRPRAKKRAKKSVAKASRGSSSQKV